MTLTEVQDRSRNTPGAFVKTGTGALFRIGREELFLLRGLIDGTPFVDLAEEFRRKMHFAVGITDIQSFAADMVGKKVLTGEDATANTPQRRQRPAVVASNASETRGMEKAAEAESAADESPEKTGPRPEAGRDTRPEAFAFDAGSDDEDDDEDDLGRVEIEEVLRFGQKAESARKQTTGFGGADPRIAQREMAFEGKEPEPNIRDMDIVLFNPSSLLRGLTKVFWPLAYVISSILLPLGLLAILSIFNRLSEVQAAVFASSTTFSLAAILVMSLFTVNLVTRLVIGAVIQRRGGEVRRFGVNFLFFLIPRFAIDMTALAKLDRDGRIAVFASALRTRFAIFALATLFWAMFRQSGTSIDEIMAILGQMALFSFLLLAFPLFGGEGYQLLCAHFQQPMLRERSISYLFGLKSAPKDPSAADRWAYSLFGMGSLLTSALLATLLVAYLSTALERRFNGTGVVIFLVLLGLTLVWFMVSRARGRKLRKHLIKEHIAAQKATQDGGAPGRPGLPALRPANTLPVPAQKTSMQVYKPLPGLYGDNAKGSRFWVWVRRFLGIGMLAGAVFVAFLPYNYETGGDFTVLADDRVQVVARVPSELALLAVDEGDIVAEGDLLAELDNTRERHQLQVSQAELAKARAQLRNLEEGASAEEIRVAEEQVERQRVQLPYLQSEAERAEELRGRGVIPEAEAERLIGAYETGKAEMRAAEANLEKVRAAASATEIAILQADIDRLVAEVDYNQSNLDATRIAAPVAGRVVFAREGPVVGKYYDRGTALMEIEDHSIARAEIKVPEADVGLVEVGERVRLKFWSLPGEEKIGTVSSFAPVAEDEEFGKIVRVKTSLANENGQFRPGMTGYAKIEGAEMKVWEAYTRLFVRFFLIEFWGWIP
ncbi:HlyD family secretion protein [Roseivivax lentus]|uniref:HlyD family secretion protein n=1 Tax=Roseivivax lentus TaxID=633194 RepID=UPI000970723C|nr:efflux RND transporter periplasmic adaptor subunit [Roseivivax lentus]